MIALARSVSWWGRRLEVKPKLSAHLLTQTPDTSETLTLLLVKIITKAGLQT